MNPDNVLATSIQLERSLSDNALRKDRAHLEQLLAEDFHEIAASGRSLTRQEIPPDPNDDMVVDPAIQWTGRRGCNEP
jgi:hypothetical protein